MNITMRNLTILTCLANVSFLSLVAQGQPPPASADRIVSLPPGLEWTEVNPDAAWSPRAGLQVVEPHNTFFLMGGRTPIDPAVLPVPGASVIWSDVWRSRDLGRSWQPLIPTGAPGHWLARASFQAVTKGNAIYVLGGQNFKQSPWNATTPEEIKYDFKALPVHGGPGRDAAIHLHAWRRPGNF